MEFAELDGQPLVFTSVCNKHMAIRNVLLWSRKARSSMPWAAVHYADQVLIGAALNDLAGCVLAVLRLA